MINRNVIKTGITQTLAITEINIKLDLRFKGTLIISYIRPIVTILMPLIIFSRFLEYNSSIGPWTHSTFLVFLYTAYEISILQTLIARFDGRLREQKYWKTLSALIIAPFNKIILLLGILFSSLIIISVPFIVFFIITYIIFPISLITLIGILTIYFLIALIFSGIGLIIGIYAISNENVWGYLRFGLELVLWASCITYPFQLFPVLFQDIIRLNPFFYFFDVLRMAWLENDLFTTISTHLLSFSVLILASILIPLTSMILFNKVYKKYGIVGY